MPLNQKTGAEVSRQEFSGFGRLLAAIMILAWLTEADRVDGQIVQPLQMGKSPQVADRDVISGVYLPTDRSLSRAVKRAQERLADREFQEALTFLQDLLGRDEDSFLERTDDGQNQPGLKATARQLIGSLPPEGLVAYEALYGPTARRQLEAALKTGNRDGVAAVVRQYFHTSAGYEATYVLAQMEADQGHRRAAAQLFQELLETPRAAARFEPQLSLAAAINNWAAGQRESAAARIQKLIESNPSSRATIVGQAIPLPSRGTDPLEWLKKQVGEIETKAALDSDWLTFRGDSTRNVEIPGGKPHLRARWEARVVNEPAVEAFLSGRAADFVQRNIVAMPAARPIAVGDTIIMRTPENVVAVDWRTGKRVWETRDEQELMAEETPADLAPASDQDLLMTHGRPLEERTWDDELAASLSSDGARVFIVRGMHPGREEWSSPFQVNGAFGRMGGFENVTLSNKLVAYDLATQGKLVWELDGGQPAGPLAGAFFLGPPLAVDHTLFAMAEIRSALYLLAIDPATGRLEWQQPLIGLEQGIALDPIRRRIAATPSYSSGIVVCPTAASTVIGIDVVRRELSWVYRYAREAPSAADGRNLWQQQQVQMRSQLVRANDQWMDNTALIVEDHVLVTPPESGELHCLDLQTGQLLWKRPQEDLLFIGGVADGVVLLVGARSVRGVRLSDRAAAWQEESLALPAGALPAGQGYLSQGRYYLPLTSGQIAEIEMSAGKITTLDPPNPDVVLGNLICYRGSVISQSPLVLDKFEQLEVMQQRTHDVLARDPANASALQELAEIKSAGGEEPEAIRLLKHALDLVPGDPGIRAMLVERLLAAMSRDYATYRGDVPLVSRLVREREQQVELMRIIAAGEDTAGARLAAWDAYWRLADFTADEPAFLQIDDAYRVRSDRWIASHLGNLWSAATPEERRVLSARLAERRPETAQPRTSTDMRHFLAHAGELPEAVPVRHALAKFLMERDRPQEAEIELLQLIDKGDPARQATAKEMLDRLVTKADQPLAAMEGGWPGGQVESVEIGAKTGEQSSGRIRPGQPRLERQNGYRQLRLEQDYWPGFSHVQWFVALDGPEIVARDGFGNDVARWTLDQNRFMGPREAGVAHGARLGHLLIVTLGNRVMALDTRQAGTSGESELLWPKQAASEYSLPSARLRRAAVMARTGRPVVYHAYSGRRRLMGAAANLGGELGPVAPSGIVLQEQDELKCVDPLSGEALWYRTDIPEGCELFGDGELVFAADVGNHVAYVMRMSDGQLLGKREIPRAEWLSTAGRQIAQISFGAQSKGKFQITITDIWSQQPVYQAEFTATARVSVIEPNLIAIVEPAGAFHLLDVGAGRVKMEQRLNIEGELQSIYTMRWGDELFLSMSTQAPTQSKPIGPVTEFPIVNGAIYAIDLKAEKMIWAGPAKIRNRGLVLQQPTDLPVLVFADRQTIRDASSGGGLQLRVLCLDRRTGQTVYRNDHLSDTSAARFRIRGKTDPVPTVAIEMSTGKIELAMTTRPRSPQPPANDDVEAPREDSEHGLRAVGQRLGNALRGALEEKVQQPQAAQPDNAPQPPTVKNPPELDDD